MGTAGLLNGEEMCSVSGERRTVRAGSSFTFWKQLQYISASKLPVLATPAFGLVIVVVVRARTTAISAFNLCPAGTERRARHVTVNAAVDVPENAGQHSLYGRIGHREFSGRTERGPFA